MTKVNKNDEKVNKNVQKVNEKPKKLTAKQQKFIDEYLIDLNATQAAIKAGYNEKCAKEIGYENLTKPHIIGNENLKKPEIQKYIKC